MLPSLLASRSGRPGRPMMARVVSSLVLAPLALLAIEIGPPASDGLLIAVGGILGWEWGRICGRRRGFGAAERTVTAAVAAAVCAGALLGPAVALWVAAAGAVAAALVTALDARRRDGEARGAEGSRGGKGDLSLWFGFGVLYLAVPLLALQWLRGPAGPEGEAGRLLLYWLIGVVWATDIGAFATGRSLKGPKLWPRISPHKTWAGMIGGLIASAAVGAAFALLALPEGVWRVVGVSILLSFVSQAGDFFESGVKRQFGVKDASDLIPGHGGLLDRLDGLLAATVALAILAWVGKAPL